MELERRSKPRSGTIEEDEYLLRNENLVGTVFAVFYVDTLYNEVGGSSLLVRCLSF
jgi:hypothetical protein